MDKYCSKLELQFGRGVYSGNGYAGDKRNKINSNIAWLISPKIDMDTHTNEKLTFQAAQHHLDIDSPLNALEVLVSILMV
jgi:hypothetical protein